MARCLNPRTIPRPGKTDAPHNCPPMFWRESCRPYLNDTIVVPCGKCINCLKNRQSSMVVRIKREAEKRGTLVFLTLTYDDDHLPLAQSLWSVDRDTGEETLECPAEIISSGRFPDPARLGYFKKVLPSDRPRYWDIPIPAFSVADPGKDYFARITPSVCREDVRLFIKRCRVAYKRAFKTNLEFSYVSIQEYGPRTCRPHAHLALMGLSRDTATWLSKQWSFGFTKCDFVNRLDDKDKKRDPWSAVSFYIGKYMAKGKFECQSVIDGASEKPRVCQSLGLGTGDFDKLVPYVVGYDIFGKYDLSSLRLESGAKLTQKQLAVLCREIPKRLVYELNDKVTLPLPRLIRNKIFYVKKENERSVPTSIWYLVSASIRAEFVDLREREFRQFLADHPERTDAQNCAAFEASLSYVASLEAASRETDLQEFYYSSKF